jgi:hypothetical protein
MPTRATWKPHTTHGELDTRDRDRLPDSVYAFPKQRKEPLTDAAHVKNALARFDQVQDVSEAERDLAFANIKKAARHYGVDVQEKSWRELGTRPHTPSTSWTRCWPRPNRSRRDRLRGRARSWEPQ